MSKIIMDEKILKKRLDKFSEDKKKDASFFETSLKEKGIECAILLPIIETIMSFDALEDIEYEPNSKESSGQRFDFLLDGKFLIEAKRMSYNFSKDSEAKNQIENYILNNSNINYGILSNGYNYSFFLQVDYVKGFLKSNEKLDIPIKNNILPVFSINIDNDYFFDIMRLFSNKECNKNKKSYEYHFERIAQYILGQHKSGGINKIVASGVHNDINNFLKEIIQKNVGVTKGDYLDLIREEKCDEGDIFTFEEDNISIKFELLNNGCLKLIDLDYKGSRKVFTAKKYYPSMVKMMDTGIGRVFPNKDAFIREFLDAKITSKIAQKYIFKCNSVEL